MKPPRHPILKVAITATSIIWLYIKRDSEAKTIEVIFQHSANVFWFLLPTLRSS